MWFWLGHICMLTGCAFYVFSDDVGGATFFVALGAFNLIAHLEGKEE